MSLLPWLPLAPLLLLQSWYVRQSTPRFPPPLGETTGLIPGDGPPLRLLMIGESPVAGVGVQTMQDALVGQTAQRLAQRSGRPVAWTAFGRSGATVHRLTAELLPDCSTDPVDLVVLAFGVNDTTHMNTPDGFVDDIRVLLEGLRACVGPAPALITAVPPLDRFPALPWPLSRFLGSRSHALDAALQTYIDTQTDVSYVHNTLKVEPAYFSPDFYHPNEAGYALWGGAIADVAADMLKLTS